MTGVVCLAILALASWAIWFGFYLTPTVFALGLGLGFLCALERTCPVSLGVGKTSFEFGGAPILFALVLGGPACALVAALPSAVYRDPSRTAFQGSVHVAQVLAGGLVFSLLCPSTLLAFLSQTSDAEYASPTSLGLATLAAGLVFYGLDALIGPTLMLLKYGLSWREVILEIVVPALPSDALAVATVLVAVPTVALGGPLTAIVLLGGTLLSSVAMDRIREQRKRALRLEEENAALKDALRDSNTELASQLVRRLGYRDGHAADHAAASAVYAYDVAREMGLGEERAREVRVAALLMDVGLLWLPDEILLTAPEKLNSLGSMRLEEHPMAGEEVLASVPGLEVASRWVRWHHERPDGAGYPDRLRGQWTPTESKILAVCSLYASLVLQGPHSPGLSPNEARRALVRGMGTAVDEEVARALLMVLSTEDPTYASASDDRFSFPARERKINASAVHRR
ncbi:HD domain-containing protein [Rubrobacter tropicus]|uniref:HD domain-containing protein n=1 Tax=Rubrobacter tropicus TaxID=2653851 RepID=A0A6G8QCX3_9ACTN|nr:HD domain-containing protein [Rubrobacter tropicus]